MGRPWRKSHFSVTSYVKSKCRSGPRSVAVGELMDANHDTKAPAMEKGALEEDTPRRTFM